jgi:hypothetical protein
LKGEVHQISHVCDWPEQHHTFWRPQHSGPEWGGKKTNLVALFQGWEFRFSWKQRGCRRMGRKGLVPLWGCGLRGLVPPTRASGGPERPPLWTFQEMAGPLCRRMSGNPVPPSSSEDGGSSSWPGNSKLASGGQPGGWGGRAPLPLMGGQGTVPLCLSCLKTRVGCAVWNHH